MSVEFILAVNKMITLTYTNSYISSVFFVSELKIVPLK
jgi:hypothetical protein